MNLRYDYYVKSVVRRHYVAPSVSPPFNYSAKQPIVCETSKCTCDSGARKSTSEFAKTSANLSTFLSRKTELLSVIRKARPFFDYIRPRALYIYAFVGNFHFQVSKLALRERLSRKYHFRQSSRHGGVASDPLFAYHLRPNCTTT